MFAVQQGTLAFFILENQKNTEKPKHLWMKGTGKRIGRMSHFKKQIHKLCSVSVYPPRSNVLEYSAKNISDTSKK